MYQARRASRIHDGVGIAGFRGGSRRGRQLLTSASAPFGLTPCSHRRCSARTNPARAKVQQSVPTASARSATWPAPHWSRRRTAQWSCFSNLPGIEQVELDPLNTDQPDQRVPSLQGADGVSAQIGYMCVRAKAGFAVRNGSKSAPVLSRQSSRLLTKHTDIAHVPPHDSSSALPAAR